VVLLGSAQCLGACQRFFHARAFTHQERRQDFQALLVSVDEQDVQVG
jgi:hypothetical protein